MPTNSDNDGVKEEIYVDPYSVWDEEPQEEEEEQVGVDDWTTCIDRHEDCPSRAEDNECTTNPGFMHVQCAESCNTCQDFYAANGEFCTDNDASCMTWAKSGECGFNPGYMHNECRRSCLRCFVDT